MFFLHSAMASKRTLVLPRVRLLRRAAHGGGRGGFDRDAEYVRWSELFKISVLAALHPVRELDAYFGAHGWRVDRLVRINCAPCSHPPSPPCASVEQSFGFNGLDDVRAAAVQCAGGLEHNVRTLWRIDDAAVAFADSSN